MITQDLNVPILEKSGLENETLVYHYLFGYDPNPGLNSYISDPR